MRLARELLKDSAAGNELKVFLLGDAAAGAKGGQKDPQGYYSIEALLRGIAARGAEVGVCCTCMDARGLTDAELAKWTGWTDQVLAF